MKLVIERAALMKSLSHVQSVVERRNAIAILSNVLIEGIAGHLRLSTTDMDVSITDQVAAETGQEGATTAPVHTLYDIVRKLPEGAQVELDATDGGRLVLRAGRSMFTLSCLPKEDFPSMPEDNLPHSFTLPADVLRALIDRTRFAISTEETRYYLNGIYCHAAETDGVKVLRAVATDGHRLARIQMPLPDGASEIPGVIIPRKAVLELRRLIEESSDPIEISLSDTRIRFVFDNVVLVSKLIDGTFPDYQRVIPAGNDRILEVDCSTFTEAVDRVATISTEKSRAIKLSLDKGSLVLTANSPDAGTATEELEVSYAAEPMEIGFNSRYLLDITERIDGPGAQFVLADAASPTLIQDTADSSALYVLMPMRV
jgi:DNA polymerase-3 subunit beta